MTATVNSRTTKPMTTRRHTWRTGDCSSWASRTPVCSVSGPTRSFSTQRTVVSGVPRRAAPHPFGSGTRTGAAAGISARGSAAHLLPLLGGQLALEHLAGGRDRDGVDEHDVAEPLVGRHLVVDRGHHRLGGQRRTVVVALADDVGDGELTGVLVG